MQEKAFCFSFIVHRSAFIVSSRWVGVDLDAGARDFGFDGAKDSDADVVGFVKAKVALDFKVKVYKFLRA